jgi:uncharacterized protein YigE (DUF2233 family)
MQTTGRRPFAIVLAGLCLSLSFAGSAAAEPCAAETYEGHGYVVCRFDLTASDVRFFWKKPDGTPYAAFSTLAEALEKDGASLAFAMNGGMYGDDLRPIGLYIEDGKELRAINTATSDARPAPNFYKKPNGVFYLGDGEAGVVTTEDFIAKRPAAEFATQSGPMLVIDGKLHPAFILGSDSVKPRNGVCAPSPTEVVFAITEDGVNFYDFGLFFRDHLGCDNALFLDGGSAPGLYSPELGRDDPPGHGGYGPIIAVVSPD